MAGHIQAASREQTTAPCPIAPRFSVGLACVGQYLLRGREALPRAAIAAAVRRRPRRNVQPRQAVQQLIGRDLAKAVLQAGSGGAGEGGVAGFRVFEAGRSKGGQGAGGALASKLEVPIYQDDDAVWAPAGQRARQGETPQMPPCSWLSAAAATQPGPAAPTHLPGDLHRVVPHRLDALRLNVVGDVLILRQGRGGKFLFF